MMKGVVSNRIVDGVADITLHNGQPCVVRYGRPVTVEVKDPVLASRYYRQLARTGLVFKVLQEPVKREAPPPPEEKPSEGGTTPPPEEKPSEEGAPETPAESPKDDFTLAEDWAAGMTKPQMIEYLSTHLSASFAELENSGKLEGMSKKQLAAWACQTVKGE